MVPPQFMVTGFGKFAGVDANPTQELVERLLRDFAVNAGSGGLKFACETLKVSARTVDLWLPAAASQVTSHSERSAVIWLHFGVDSRADCFKLETTAYNDATFRQPDIDGWGPRGHTICEVLPHAAELSTSLPTDILTERLASKGHRVCESGDAGRYVCNYLYFNSLRQVQAACVSSPDRDWHALFVHMPPTSVCSMPEQYRFAQDLIHEITAWFRARELPLIIPAPVPASVASQLTDQPALAPA
ncbi:hypothetical protein WJX74_005385 [Apatococcus lobatus]|uniref:Pyrrolidone-carboxylate peptidase n=1 Tax=Apatococcus lobatus TaxID=904363 RepID=A0AAW1QXK5_9CHLO